MGKILFLLIFIFILFSVYFYSQNKSINLPISSIGTKIVDDILPSPTPKPFYELTIPYLRGRSYEGILGELILAYNRGNYEAYTTSYISDGLRVNGLLTKPSGVMPEGGWPGVVFIHGYIPPTQYLTLERYTDHVDFLARNGLAVFKIDLRGHGNSEGEASGAYYSSDYIIDVLSAVNALGKSGFVNPEKIGLWGHSMAGNVLMRSMAVKPDIKAAVIVSGAVYTYIDLGEYGISDSSYQPPGNSSERARRRQRIRDVYGDPSADSPFWREIAPSNYLTDLKGAIQIHHATNDNVVSINYSRNLNGLLDKTNVPHEIFEYQSGGHNLIGSSFTQAMQRSVEFFKKYL
ncbi:hypothetical protein A2773_02400 [Candidatus Gottesmanbacteria bacterium RIFCSPHIGHO2_01_FULL_39_10]|uniref:Serine aminopeptidase S33 domain-containing protein n=1 Tax=Candidatus Gottesmanbacteria bacterium RIFCSPHIGHO2_01_FULL_39_10 TaxID=1798375 RepID=A0A1F5ZQL5_9BACT|nr:MAG: hypothetical protein A2773_02400 [Candidatus Gottesmanbacteria bacterium RIFCSPHIGHO2_01_FULL_39_10]